MDTRHDLAAFRSKLANVSWLRSYIHDSDARAVVEHVKKSCGGPNRGMSLYLREWEMQDGSPGIHVSGDVAAGWRKWECKAQQMQRRHWEDTAPLYPLHSRSPWSWHADWEGHTLATWYKGTGMHPSLFFPLTTTPLYGVQHHRVSIPVDFVDHRHVDDLKDFKQGAMLSNLASFLSFGWPSFRMSMGNLGQMRGRTFLMRIGPPRLVQGTVTPAAH